MTKGDLARALWITCVIAWVVVIAWLDLTGEGIRAWFKSQAILSVSGIIIGFIILSWQLSQQHLNTLDANQRQSQDRLTVELYNLHSALRKPAPDEFPRAAGRGAPVVTVAYW